MTGFQIFDRGFIHLHIAVRQDARADVFVNELQPLGGQCHPPGQCLTRQMHLVAVPEDLFLPIQRKVIAVFADQHLRQQARCGQAAIQQPFRQGCDHGRLVEFHPVNVFAADHAAAQKAGRFVIELFADFLADATPALRRGFHRLGINHFFDSRQVLWAGSSCSLLAQNTRRTSRSIFCRRSPFSRCDSASARWHCSSWRVSSASRGVIRNARRSKAAPSSRHYNAYIIEL
ncbi:MAG: hypothetical protein RL514_4628 [Verrucomicrobiota bacterium]|jgi:hypothetical protein